jgi:hypothetical protein
VGTHRYVEQHRHRQARTRAGRHKQGRHRQAARQARSQVSGRARHLGWCAPSVFPCWAGVAFPVSLLGLPGLGAGSPSLIAQSSFNARRSRFPATARPRPQLCAQSYSIHSTPPPLLSYPHRRVACLSSLCPLRHQCHCKQAHVICRSFQAPNAAHSVYLISPLPLRPNLPL